MSEDQKTIVPDGEVVGEVKTMEVEAKFESLPEIKEDPATTEQTSEPMSPEAREAFDKASEAINESVKDLVFDPKKNEETVGEFLANGGETHFVTHVVGTHDLCDGVDMKALIDEESEKIDETEFWLSLDNEYDKGDEYVVPVDDHIKEVETLMSKIEGLELVNKELSDANKDGATVIKSFVAYRKWVLSLGQRLATEMEGQNGWREKIAFGKKFAKELVAAAAQFDIGLKTDVETEEDKATKKEKQRDMVVRVYDMATQSLNPDSFAALEKALEELSVTRKLGWAPKKE